MERSRRNSDLIHVINYSVYTNGRSQTFEADHWLSKGEIEQLRIDLAIEHECEKGEIFMHFTDEKKKD